jgi:pilus assembly protein CpaF
MPSFLSKSPKDGQGPVNGAPKPVAPRSTAPRPAAPGSREDTQAQDHIRDRVQQRLLSELSLTVSADNTTEVENALERILNEVVAEEGLPLSRAERATLLDQIVATTLGYGPIEPFLRDESVTEILVNGPDMVYVERNGLLELTDLRFRDAQEVMRVVERIVTPIGRRVDESSPMVDARLPDGSRVNVIIPPLALCGPCISIRKFSHGALTSDDLLRGNALTKDMIAFLRAAVTGRLNVVVSGGTSTGKTTFLNMLSSFIPDNERIITIEDAAELQLQQRHIIRLEARPANVEGKGQVPIRQLVVNALRMRPDRIVVGEVRSGEALDMLQAMNTGHDGSMTTVHSNSPRDTLHRVETMVLMAGVDLPLRAVREQIASAFDVVVHLNRLADGSRKVVSVAEVQSMEGDVIVMQDIFKFMQTGFQAGRVQGYFTATGVRPKFVDKLDALGIYLSPSTFNPTPGEAKKH